MERYFKSHLSHNTIEIDGDPPVHFLSRFLAFPWPRGMLRHFDTTSQEPLYFEGEHYDYDRRPWNVLHRRTLLSLDDDTWVVVDDLLGKGQHEAMLRWHMLDVPYEFDASTATVGLQTAHGVFYVSVIASGCKPQSAEVVRGRDERDRVQGFAAPYYCERLPIPTLEIGYRTELPLRILTLLLRKLPLRLS